MDIDWNDGAIIIGLLLAVLISWWGPITRGSTADLWALSLADSHGTDTGDFTFDPVFQSSDATPDSFDTDGFNFFEIFVAF